MRAAREALAELEEAKAEAAERESAISEITHTLRVASGQNHFAPLIRAALRGDFR